ncbi:MAG: M16 family metallopeptidase [Candidatus Eisenbacteria bacterium]
MTHAIRNRRVALVAVAVAALLAIGTGVRAQGVDPRTIPTPELNPVRSVKPERYVMPNGIVVYLLEDHDLPRVSCTSYFKMGPALIPDDKVGLGGLTGEVMRSGGSAKHAGDWLDDRLAAIGARVSASVSNDQAGGGFYCLSDDLPEVLGLWAEVLRAPAFPEDKIELAKVGLRRSIAERNDEATALLFRLARETVYGKGSPYARKPEYATVEAITRADCVKLHDAVFVPNRMIVAVYGDFKSAEMKKLLSASLGSWAKSATPAPVLGPDPKPQTARLVFAPKEDVTQSGLVLCEPGSRADDPDYAAMQVFEQALGGGFQSRLFSRIRTQRGLAYAAGCNSGTDFARAGVFYAYTLTRSDSTLTALALLRHEVAATVEEPFTDAELTAARQTVENGFVFNFEDPSQTLFRRAYYEFVGYPADFLERYQSALHTVDGAQVLAAARRKIHPDRQVAVVVGKESDFDGKLESAGLPVERVDITIPPPSSHASAARASPEALTRGAALLAAAAGKAGGSAAWAGVRTAVIESDATVTMQGQTMALTSSQTWAFPDRQLTVQKLPMGERRQGVSPSGAWVSMMGQTQDNPQGAGQLRKDYERSLFHLFSKPDAFQVEALDEPVTVDSVSYRAARVRSELVDDWTLLFAADGGLAGMRFTTEGQNGPSTMTVTYGDWRPEGPIRYPHALRTLADGKPFLEAKVTVVKLDSGVTDDVFQKPK